MKWTALGAVLVPLAAGCSGGAGETALTPCEDAARSAASLEIGTGAEVFETVSSGQSVGYVQGPQGGFHVWGSLRVSGVLPGDPADFSNPDNPIVTYKVLYADGSELGGFTGLPRGFSPSDEGSTYEIVGETLLIGIQSGDQVEGEAATLSAEVTDSCGTTVTNEVDVVLTFLGLA